MKAARKLAILTVAFAFVSWFTYSSTFVHRGAHTAAFSNWLRNPTPENQTLLDHEAQIDENIRMFDGAVVGAAITNVVFVLWTLLEVVIQKRSKARI